jgi:hypothetical protein
MRAEFAILSKLGGNLGRRIDLVSKLRIAIVCATVLNVQEVLGSCREDAEKLVASVHET